MRGVCVPGVLGLRGLKSVLLRPIVWRLVIKSLPSSTASAVGDEGVDNDDDDGEDEDDGDDDDDDDDDDDEDSEGEEEEEEGAEVEDGEGATAVEFAASADDIDAEGGRLGMISNSSASMTSTPG